MALVSEYTEGSNQRLMLRSDLESAPEPLALGRIARQPVCVVVILRLNGVPVRR